MVSWPHTRLHYGGDRCVAISGPHIQVVHAPTGEILHATKCATNILCSAIDAHCSHIVTTGDDKQLRVWAAAGLVLKSARELPKKVTAIKLTGDGHTIIAADKFGDVFSYPLDPPTSLALAPTRMAEAKRESVASHENPHGALVLGHASIITTFLLSHDGRCIITADRDEHIRVSRYPQGYIIERYCLGHERYVSALCLPSFSPGILVSGGGDPHLNIWDWMSGTLTCQIPILDCVRPFLRVKENKQHWHRRQAAGRPPRAGRKGRRRGKKANDQNEEKEEQMVVDESVEPVADAINTEEPSEEEEPVLAVANIEAFEFDGEKVLVFSATGGTALFYCNFPSGPSEVPSLRHLDLAHPILDFGLGPGGHILISIDVDWGSTEESPIKSPVRAVTWREGESDIIYISNYLIASASEVAALGLYADLALLPKHADGPEYGEGDDPDPEVGDGDASTVSQSDAKKPTARIVGRLKTKQALLKKQELEQTSSRSVSGDERESKRAKLDEED
ncbi:WD40-repeat-containing domain protein [Hysterangium stoloniferum]|nr:WD40-repeat-containing domain protein [Hysterangium stoloniferum]